MRLRYLFVPALLASTFPLIAADPPASLPPRVFPHPNRIRYDDRCLTIDGKDFFVYSGSFHYFRCPKELWQDRFARIKAAGFNTVETYFPWNAHERQMPASTSDFSKIDTKDAEDFLTMAEQNGLYVIARPGPYICAEWDRGGFPAWLPLKRPADFKGQWLRSDDPAYLSWSKHWFDAIVPVIARHQITRKKPGEPGVILFQIENEYNYAKFPDTVKINHLRALAQYATADGIDVPLFTCWSRQIRGSADPLLRNVFDSCNFYTGWDVDKQLLKDIPQLGKDQPDAPQMTTELQGGWFTKSTETPFLRPDTDAYRPDLAPVQIQNLTLQAIANGETVLNYYMLFGGTNFGDSPALGINSSYDYSSPIRENGGVGEKYLRVQALAQFLKDHGSQLARASAVNVSAQTGFPDVTVTLRQSTDGAMFFFIRTSQHDQPRKGTAIVSAKSDFPQISFAYDLEPFGAKVLYVAPKDDISRGEWLPRQITPLERPAQLPAAVKIADIQSFPDVVTNFKPIAAGQSLLDLGIYHNYFVYYHTTANISAEQLKAKQLLLEADIAKGDAVALLVNDKFVAPQPKTANAFDLSGILHEGSNSLIFLYENAGTSNGGNSMEKKPGITALRLLADNKHTDALAPLEVADEFPRHAAAYSAPDFMRLNADGAPAGDPLVTVHRLTFALPAPDPHVWCPSLLRLHSNGNGFLYLNGHPLARTWQAAKQTDYYLPECWLNAGGKSNVIVYAARAVDKPVAIESAEIIPYTFYAEKR